MTSKRQEAPDPECQVHQPRFAEIVVVLADPRNVSAAEDFVVSFVATKRGTLVVETTVGGTGVPLAFKLPDGGIGRVCAKQDRFPDDRGFVGKGIAPDIPVAPTAADIRAGRDPVLARAAALLRQRPQ